MSLRQVLTIYNAERLLSDDETALLNTLRRMSDGDRQMFIDGLAGKSSQKKSSKKSAGGGGGRSRRAASLAEKVSGTASRTVVGPVCGTCGNVEDHPDHDTAHYLSAHEFQPPATTAASGGGG